jgi:hypothetical protein
LLLVVVVIDRNKKIWLLVPEKTYGTLEFKPNFSNSTSQSSTTHHDDDVVVVIGGGGAASE